MSFSLIKTSNVFFVRHAESFNNCIFESIYSKYGKNISEEKLLEEEGKLRQPDCDLSERGKLQAKKLGEFIQRGGFHSISSMITDSDEFEIFSSPMKRTLLTAEQISLGMNNVDVTVMSNLYESSGCYKYVSPTETIGIKGSTKYEIESCFPRFKCIDGMEEGWYTLPTIETKIQFKSRVSDITNWIMSLVNNTNKKTRNIVIVGHGNVMCAVINSLLGSNSIIMHHNTGCTLLQFSTIEKRSRPIVALKYQNRVDHLMPDLTMLSGADVIDDHWIPEYLEYVL